MLCFFWRGIKPEKDSLKFTITRHFEGVPMAGLKDLLATRSPEYNPKTLEYALNT